MLRVADALREQGVAHVMYFDAGKTPSPNALHVRHFAHAFFATLRNKSATVPEVRHPCRTGPSLQNPCALTRLPPHRVWGLF